MNKLILYLALGLLASPLISQPLRDLILTPYDHCKDVTIQKEDYFENIMESVMDLRRDDDRLYVKRALENESSDNNLQYAASVGTYVVPVIVLFLLACIGYCICCSSAYIQCCVKCCICEKCKRKNQPYTYAQQICPLILYVLFTLLAMACVGYGLWISSVLLAQVEEPQCALSSFYNAMFFGGVASWRGFQSTESDLYSLLNAHQTVVAISNSMNSYVSSFDSSVEQVRLQIRNISHHYSTPDSTKISSPTGYDSKITLPLLHSFTSYSDSSLRLYQLEMGRQQTIQRIADKLNLFRASAHNFTSNASLIQNSLLILRDILIGLKSDAESYSSDSLDVVGQTEDAFFYLSIVLMVYFSLLFVLNLLGCCGTICVHRNTKSAKRLVNCSWGGMGALMLGGLALFAAMVAGAVMFDDYCYSFDTFFSIPQIGMFHKIKPSFVIIDYCVTYGNEGIRLTGFEYIDAQYNTYLEYKQTAADPASSDYHALTQLRTDILVYEQNPHFTLNEAGIPSDETWNQAILLITRETQNECPSLNEKFVAVASECNSVPQNQNPGLPNCFVIPVSITDRFYNNCGNPDSIVTKILRARNSFIEAIQKVNELKQMIMRPNSSSLESKYTQAVGIHQSFQTGYLNFFEQHARHYFEKVSYATNGLLKQIECDWMIAKLNDYRETSCKGVRNTYFIVCLVFFISLVLASLITLCGTCISVRVGTLKRVGRPLEERKSKLKRELQYRV